MNGIRYRIVPKVGFPETVQADSYRTEGKFLVFYLDGREVFRYPKGNVAGVRTHER